MNDSAREGLLPPPVDEAALTAPDTALTALNIADHNTEKLEAEGRMVESATSRVITITTPDRIPDGRTPLTVEELQTAVKDWEANPKEHQQELELFDRLNKHAKDAQEGYGRRDADPAVAVSWYESAQREWIELMAMIPMINAEAVNGVTTSQNGISENGKNGNGSHDPNGTTGEKSHDFNSLHTIANGSTEAPAVLTGIPDIAGRSRMGTGLAGEMSLDGTKLETLRRSVEDLREDKFNRDREDDLARARARIRESIAEKSGEERAFDEHAAGAADRLDRRIDEIISSPASTTPEPTESPIDRTAAHLEATAMGPGILPGAPDATSAMKRSETNAFVDAVQEPYTPIPTPEPAPYNQEDFRRNLRDETEQRYGPLPEKERGAIGREYIKTIVDASIDSARRGMSRYTHSRPDIREAAARSFARLRRLGDLGPTAPGWRRERADEHKRFLGIPIGRKSESERLIETVTPEQVAAVTMQVEQAMGEIPFTDSYDRSTVRWTQASVTRKEDGGVGCAGIAVIGAVLAGALLNHEGVIGRHHDANTATPTEISGTGREQSYGIAYDPQTDTSVSSNGADADLLAGGPTPSLENPLHPSVGGFTDENTPGKSTAQAHENNGGLAESNNPAADEILQALHTSRDIQPGSNTELEVRNILDNTASLTPEEKQRFEQEFVGFMDRYLVILKQTGQYDAQQLQPGENIFARGGFQDDDVRRVIDALKITPEQAGDVMNDVLTQAAQRGQQSQP